MTPHCTHGKDPKCQCLDWVTGEKGSKSDCHADIEDLEKAGSDHEPITLSVSANDSIFLDTQTGNKFTAQISNYPKGTTQPSGCPPDNPFNPLPTTPSTSVHFGAINTNQYNGTATCMYKISITRANGKNFDPHVQVSQ